MLPVLLAEDVRHQDASAAAQGIAVGTLMESAGWAVARAAVRILGGAYGRRIVVVCGKGNNAGDGLVAGRFLAARGAHVTAVLTSPDDRLSELASANLARFPGRVVHLDELPREIARADLIIDAVFGVGLSRAPEGEPGEAIRECARAAAPVLSVDVPSGVDADTGSVPGDAVRARATVTLSGYKPGLFFEPGRSRAGEVELADIGAPRSDTKLCVIEESDAAYLIPKRAPGAHKRSAGTVLVVAGSRAMPGAAALVTKACVEAGAGLTTLCAPEDVCRIALAHTPEITTIPVPETSEGTLDAKALDLIRPRLQDFTTMVVGPGLTTHPGTVDAVRALLEEVTIPIVLDADGLNAATPELVRARPGGTILTPHAGELSRLVGRPVQELEADRLGAARAAARDLGCIVVFKGPGTVTAAVYAWINPTGGPGLAQGGTGDALSGMLGALVAGRIASGETLNGAIVAAGVWLHGRAGDRVAARVSPHPSNASALIAELGPLMHEVAGA